METFEIKYNPKVTGEDIPSLSTPIAIAVKKAIDNKLSIHPDIFGIPLRNRLKGYKKLRVGDYRIVFQVKEVKVYIVMIGHRKSIYVEVLKRI